MAQNNDQMELIESAQIQLEYNMVFITCGWISVIEVCQWPQGTVGTMGTCTPTHQGVSSPGLLCVLFPGNPQSPFVCGETLPEQLEGPEAGTIF